jgi:hypothetical protein
MSIEPISATIGEVAKQSIKEIGKGISEGLKEGFKAGADKLSEGIKEKYLQKETLPINEISENIPSELKDISKEVSKIEDAIDFKPESVIKNSEAIKVDIKSIEGKINDFLDGFQKNIEDKVSIGTHVDHITNSGVDIIKDINSYGKELKGRLNEAGLDVDKILEHLNSAQGSIDETELEESDFDESE